MVSNPIKFDEKFWLAVFALVGTTVGAGIFGLPYVFLRSGFFIGLSEIITLGFVITVIQLITGEIALRTKGKKRLLGYADLYLNQTWRRILMISVILASVGSLLAYLILAGEFLSLLFGLNIVTGVIIFFGIWFFSLLFKSKIFGRVEFYLGLLSIALIIFVALSNVGYINASNFLAFNFQNILLPYGVILFAITGTSAMPVMEELLAGNTNKLKKAIIVGTVIPVIVYLLFVIAVLGVSGSITSPDAISGLAKALNSRFVLLIGTLIGLITISQASLSYGIYFKETLWYDLKINKWWAWILTAVPPFLLYLAGARSFIKVISIIGAVFLGFQLIMILQMHRASKLSELKPVYEIKLPKVIYWILAALLCFGALLEVWYSIIM